MAGLHQNDEVRCVAGKSPLLVKSEERTGYHVQRVELFESGMEILIIAFAVMELYYMI